MAVVECMVLGKPVVGFSASGPSETLADGAGILVTETSSRAMAGGT